MNSGDRNGFEIQLLATSILISVASACSGFPHASRSIGNCPAEIRSIDEIPGEFTIRYRVTVLAEDLNFPFELIVQKKGRELVLIGLSPLGAKVFSVIQTGTETDVDALPRAVLPIPPLNVLRDLHRLRFPVGNGPMSDLGPAAGRPGEGR